jgi:hypothetical protein
MTHASLPYRTTLVAALALSVTAVFAQTAAPGADADRAQRMHAGLQKRFAAADANGDGSLTKDEAKAGMPMVYEHFDEIDSAHTGRITLAQIESFAIAHRGAHKMGHPPATPPAN